MPNTELPYKPRLALTMGDPAGVGPETIVRVWTDKNLHDNCQLVAVGRPTIFRRATALFAPQLKVVEVNSPDEQPSSPTTLPCIACGSEQADQVLPGALSPEAGQAAYDALTTATRLALDNAVNGIVTAPLNKAALWRAGHRYPGHTELLAELCGVDQFAMMLYLAPNTAARGRIGLGIVHVTLHTALRKVFDQLTVEAIVSKARLANDVAQQLLAAHGLKEKPRIAIAALNPHGGEHGLFGDEEQRIIQPATVECLNEGLLVDGPLPCDTLMAQAVSGDFDMVVAMYHDQGHIALKLLDMHHAVNVTLGLPIVRTSVAHGTAFDLAWKGKAETSGMIEAIRTAAMLTRRRWVYSPSTPAGPSVAPSVLTALTPASTPDKVEPQVSPLLVKVRERRKSLETADPVTPASELSTELRTAIRDSYRSGITTQQLSDKYHLPPATVYEVLREVGREDLPEAVKPDGRSRKPGQFINLTCANCGSEFQRRKYVQQASEMLGSKNTYCSRDCFHEAVRKKREARKS